MRRCGSVLSILALLLVLRTDARAQWPTNGLFIQAPNSVENPSNGVIVPPYAISDGRNGMILVWNGDPVENNFAVYAARVDASGAKTWGPKLIRSGGSECSATSDGQGGAVIAWREGDDIRANRIGRTGTLLWASTGVVLCNAAGPQFSPAVTTDNAGGAIVSWMDGRSIATSSYDIYVRRVNSSGTPLWTANGVALCTAANVQEWPRITADGTGGAVVAWQDYRAGSGSSDIYARRVNAGGNAMWTLNGVAVCTATDFQFVHNLIPDGSGGAILAWDDSRAGSANEDIFVQRLNGGGAPAWTPNGVNLTNVSGRQGGAWVAANPQGGAYVAYMNQAIGSGDIHLKQVNLSGAVDPNVVGICGASGLQTSPRAVPDGAGGLLFAWEDRRGGTSNIYAQQLKHAGGDLSNGTITWTLDGVALCALTNEQIHPSIVPDLKGGVRVAWRDGSAALNSPPDHVRAGRVVAAGIANPQEMWTTDGLSVARGNGVVDPPVTVKDPSGGMYVTWSDTRTNAGDIYLQHLNPAGFVDGYWPTEGMNLCPLAGLQNDPALAAEAANVTVAWQDVSSPPSAVVVNRVSRDGLLPYYPVGLPVTVARTADQTNPSMTTDGTGNSFVVWEDARAGNLDIYAQRVNDAGTNWIDAAVTTATGDQRSPQVVYDNAGGIVVAWSGTGLHASRLNANHGLVWGPVTLDASVNASLYKGATDGAGGAFFAYTSTVGAPPQTSTASKVRRIDVNGAFPAGWSSPVFLSLDSPLMQPTGGIVMRPDGQGGIVASYGQGTEGQPTMLRVNRVRGDGTIAWGPGGPIVASNSFGGTSCEDGTGGALVAWSNGTDILMRRVLATGAFDPAYPSGGAVLCGAPGTQDSPALLLLGTGIGVGAWRDAREGTSNAVFAGRTTFDGVAPAVATLEAALARNNGVVIWYAPGDDGNSGTATSYDFRYAALPITEANWSTATPYAYGPPQGAGARECVDIPLQECSSYYFALKTTDEAGNQSLISNSPGGTTPCSGFSVVTCIWEQKTAGASDGAAPLHTELESPRPNPIRGEGTFDYAIAPLQSGERLQLAVFDIAGRRVRMVEEGIAKSGRHRASWDLYSDHRVQVTSGIYFARLVVGSFAQTRILVVR